jgi:hypothetical protein
MVNVLSFEKEGEGGGREGGKGGKEEKGEMGGDTQRESLRGARERRIGEADAAR